MAYSRYGFIGALILGSLAVAFNAHAFDHPARETALFVGIAPACNAGVVTTNFQHLICRTAPIGFTFASPTASIAAGNPNTYVPVFVGRIAGVNLGVVTTNRNHLGGRTRPIGFVQIGSVSALPGGTQLFKGVTQGCNAGVVTTNPTHLNCANRELGWTRPE
jgi:hypothetical protein